MWQDLFPLWGKGTIIQRYLIAKIRGAKIILKFWMGIYSGGQKVEIIQLQLD